MEEDDANNNNNNNNNGNGGKDAVEEPEPNANQDRFAGMAFMLMQERVAGLVPKTREPVLYRTILRFVPTGPPPALHPLTCLRPPMR